MAIRKKFREIEIPLLKTTTEILDTKDIERKTIKLDLTRQLKGKSLEITLKVFEKQDKLFAIPKKMNLMRFYIRRIMRKGTSYVEDSFKAQCKDIRVTIKPFFITRKKVSRVVKKNLRNTAKDFLLKEIKEKDFIYLCEEILSGDLQRKLLPKLKKIYPLSLCEIRTFETSEIEKADLKIKEEKPKETEEVKEEKPAKKKETKEKATKTPAKKATTKTKEETKKEK